MARLYRSSPTCLRSHEHPWRFGPDGGGLVTFLVYPPDDLVLVVKVQWLGG